MPKVKKDELRFEEAFQRLEAIVETLEGGELVLDETIKVFEEGMGLIQICTKQLNEAEARLQKLVKTESDEFRLESEE